MAECRLAFSLYTPTIYMRIYTYLFTQLSLQHHAHRPLEQHLLLAYISICLQLEIAFLCILSNEFSTSLTGIIWNLFAAASPISLIYTHYSLYHSPYHSLHIYIYDIFLSQSTKILISSPTNFVIACCVCREERKCSEFKLDFCAH